MSMRSILTLSIAGLFVYTVFGLVLSMYTDMFTAQNLRSTGLLAIMFLMITWFGHLLHLGDQAPLKILQSVTAFVCLWQAYSDSWGYQFFWCLAYVGIAALAIFLLVDYAGDAHRADALVVRTAAVAVPAPTHVNHLDEMIDTAWEPAQGYSAH